MLTFMLMSYVFHCTWVTSEAYSSPSIVLSARSHDGSQVIFDDFREAYYWLRMNTEEVTLNIYFVIIFIKICFIINLYLGCSSDVMVGLWLSNHSHG